MENRNIIVIGASTGGIEALKAIVANLPIDLNAAIFIVWHMAPDAQGVLPQILSQLHTLPATQAIEKEPIQPGRIYIAPPDRHLVLEKNRVRITIGPKENRFRPAIDPLFRSAAMHHGSRVIGVVLSGGLDDGSAGLWTIKRCGGLAVVQNPADAVVSSMPQNALDAVEADHIAEASAIGALLAKLVDEPVTSPTHPTHTDSIKIGKEINVALGLDPFKNNVMAFGELSPYACPDCHGVLTLIKDGEVIRFRCHTGHAFSSKTLLACITEQTDSYLWNAVRSAQENILLLNHLGDQLAEANSPKQAAAYFKEANAISERLKLMDQLVLGKESAPAANGKPDALPSHNFPA